MIIDSHVHLCRKPFNNTGLYKDLKKEMKLSKIDKAVVIAFYKPTDINYDTKELIENFSNDKDLILIGSVNMEKFNKKDLNQLDSLLKSNVIRGIKLYPGYQYVYPNDKGLTDVFKLCQKHDLPLIIHSGDTVSFMKDAKVRFAHPLCIDDIAVDFPKLKIIVAHLGNPWVDDCAELLLKNDNIYADISGFFYNFDNPKYNKLVVRRINDVIAHANDGCKLLFGTDWPLIPIKAYLNFMLKNIDLNKKEKEKFLYRNAMELFKIGE